MAMTEINTAEKNIRRLAEQRQQAGSQRSEIKARILQVVGTYPLSPIEDFYTRGQCQDGREDSN